MLTEEKINEFEDKISGYTNDGTLIEGIFEGQISCLTSLDGDISVTAVNSCYASLRQKHKTLMNDIAGMFNTMLMQMRDTIAEHSVALTTIDSMQNEINQLQAVVDSQKEPKKKNIQNTEKSV